MYKKELLYKAITTNNHSLDQVKKNIRAVEHNRLVGETNESQICGNHISNVIEDADIIRLLHKYELLHYISHWIEEISYFHKLELCIVIGIYPDFIIPHFQNINLVESDIIRTIMRKDDPGAMELILKYHHEAPQLILEYNYDPQAIKCYRYLYDRGIYNRWTVLLCQRPELIAKHRRMFDKKIRMPSHVVSVLNNDEMARILINMKFHYNMSILMDMVKYKIKVKTILLFDQKNNFIATESFFRHMTEHGIHYDLLLYMYENIASFRAYIQTFEFMHSSLSGSVWKCIDEIMKPDHPEYEQFRFNLNTKINHGITSGAILKWKITETGFQIINKYCPGFVDLPTNHGVSLFHYNLAIGSWRGYSVAKFPHLAIHNMINGKKYNELVNMVKLCGQGLEYIPEDHDSLVYYELNTNEWLYSCANGDIDKVKAMVMKHKRRKH